MAESSRNYQNGKIYCIRNWVDDDIYIGSSCQPLSKRMAWHKSDRKADKKKHLKIYQKMDEIGFDNFYIELIEEHPCENVEQLRRREGEIIRDMKPSLNKEIAGTTIKEWYNDNKEEKIQKIKQYINDNSEWYKQYGKEYFEKNKDKITKYQKGWYEKNKQQIQEKRSSKIDCICGGKYTLGHKSQHFNTQIHQQHLQKEKQKI